MNNRLWNKSDIYISILLLVVTFGLLGSVYNLGFYGDEFFIAHGAEKILEGKIIYRDFYTFWTPGIFYFTAFLFKTFGHDIIVTRIALILLQLLSVLVLYYLARKIMPPVFSVLTILVYISWIIYWISSYPNWYAMFLGLLALLFYSFYLEKEDHSLWWIFGAGIFVGVSMVFKQNVGAFILAALMVFSFVSNLSFVGRNNLFKSKSSTFFKSVFKENLALLIGFSFVVLFVLGLSSFYMPLSLFVSRVFFVAIKSTTSSLAIPFPSLLPLFSGGFGVRDSLIKIVFYIPVFVYGVSLLVVILKLFRNKQSKELIYFLLFLFFGIFTFLQVYPRSTLDYVIFSYASAELLGCYLFYLLYLSLGDFLKRFIQNQVIFERIKTVGLSVILSLILCFALFGIFKNVVVKKRGGVKIMNIPRSHLSVNPGIAGLMEGISGYIRAKTDPNEKIVVLPYGAIIYFLSERSNPTRFIFMFEGNYVADDGVQKEVINVLDKEKIRYVVFQDIILFGGVYLRDYARILTDYIFSNYHQEAQMSDYIILKRND